MDISEFVNVNTKEKTKDNLKDRFKKRRKELGISRIKLEKMSMVPYSTIRRFEDSGDISLDSLLKLADALNYLDDFNHLFEHPAIKSLKEYKNE